MIFHDPHNSKYKEQGWVLPPMDVTEFAPKRRRYALVIPVINEGDRIRLLLKEIVDKGYTSICDVVIADGGSTDASLEHDFLRSADIHALVVKQGAGRLSAQLRCAYAYSLDEGYEGIITMDGNGKDLVESIPRFVDALAEGVDYAQASRFIDGGQGINTPVVRLLAIRLLHAPLLSLAGRHWFSDTTQGYRAYSARYLLDPRVQPFRDIFANYELLAYLTVRAGQLGFRVREIPTTRVYPVDEVMPTKIVGLKEHWGLISVLWKTVSGKLHPSAKAHEPISKV